MELQQTDDGITRLVAGVADGSFTLVEERTVKLDLLVKKERPEARLAKLRARAQTPEDSQAAVESDAINMADRVRTLNAARFRQLASLVFAHLVVSDGGNGKARRCQIVTMALTEHYQELVNTSGTYTSAVYSQTSPLKSYSP